MTPETSVPPSTETPRIHHETTNPARKTTNPARETTDPARETTDPAREFAALISQYEHHRRAMFPLATVKARDVGSAGGAARGTTGEAGHDAAGYSAGDATGDAEPLGPAEQRLLWLLSDGVPRTLKRISEDLHLEQSTVNRQVNAALSHGVVSRSRKKGAAYTFVATQYGSTRLETTLAGLFASYREAFVSMGEADAREFVRLLGRFVDAFTASPGSMPRLTR